MPFVDAFYDIRYHYNSTTTSAAFSIGAFTGSLPITIQNMPEEQVGAVYSSGSGGYTIINYATESANGGAVSGLNGGSSSIFISRSRGYVVAASQSSSEVTVLNRNTTGGNYAFDLPGVYRVSMDPGGSIALIFVQNSNYLYYLRQLSSAQTLTYSGGPSTWPLGATDCEPQAAPAWCLFQALDPASTKANPLPLTFDRPVKAVFSADGGTAYILNCGPECGGTAASVTPMPVAPMIFLQGQASGTLPSTTTPNVHCGTVNLAAGCIPIPGGASNALVESSLMYVAGQKPQQVSGQTLFTGNLTVVNLTADTASAPVPISDGAPGAMSRMIEADNNTLWIGMTKCINGVRVATGQPYGCLTMVNITNPASPTATILPYIGDATGIAAITGLSKVYTAEGGQVYIHSTVDGSYIDNSNVTMTGTVYDVAYMDAISDSDNTVY
jgi:hypothetical protein